MKEYREETWYIWSIGARDIRTREMSFGQHRVFLGEEVIHKEYLWGVLRLRSYNPNMVLSLAEHRFVVFN